MSIARRTLLVGLVGTAAAGGAGFYLQVTRKQPPGQLPQDDHRLVFAIAELFEDLSHAERIGHRAIRELGTGSPESIASELFPTPQWDQVPQSEAVARLRTQISQEFATGHSVEVGGWILARSEALLYALIATLQLTATERPSTNRTASPRTEKPASSEPTRGKTAPHTAGDPKRGKALYLDYCSGCHQIDGRGLDGMLAADLNRKGGPLTKTDAELLEILRNGMSENGRPMPGFDELLNETQMRDILAYVRSAFGP